ncbi:MAG TPA: ABC-F family ATP-binding cassette domain-containing protein [Fimbriimonadaceae bacterium]|nr:ABC-F family ATP-binding cassette domain-containing protein [Fimbriimonadaceae bacterium]HRJ32263.1 ABC-F family ATP-binding cassette domain-containing protein [Fimbriimonadaceae bacterium]
MVVQVHHIRKLFGADIVLDGVSLRLDSREKVALVGRNGVGKSTLIKILTGELEPDGGSLQWGRGVRVGYLSQHSQLNPDHSVLDSAQAAHEDLLHLKSRLDELEQKLLDHPTDDDLDEFARLQSHFADQGGYSLERSVETVLQRMGFEPAEWEKPVRALSGGERTRLTFARLLLEEPDLLILDEPTNHLDLEATEWLESWLRGYSGAVLLVSHDRIFLENVAQRVVEMRDGQVKSYPGTYSQYLVLRQADEERQAAVARAQQDQIAKLDEYVRRFMNSQRTAQARGRLKQMEKLQASAVQAPNQAKSMAAGFGKVHRAGDLVLETQGLSMAFGAQKLFQDLNWVVRWGEKWGVVGPNGAGKSTLLKVILGQLPPVSGRIRLGANVQVGVFRQDAEDLNLELTPLEQVLDRLGVDVATARNLLGRFLITGDDVFRPIRTLSGGERNKLSLALLTAENPNVLLLDEPTNHLDMPSREALAEVLREFGGTLLLISHDRWLLGEVTGHTLDLRVEGSQIFAGSYPEYRASRDRRLAAPNAGSGAAKAGGAAGMPAENRPQLSPRELSKEITRQEKAVAQIEGEIHSTEQQLDDLGKIMASPEDGSDLLALSTRYAVLQQQLQDQLEEWESSARKLEDLRALQSEGN